LIFPIILFFNSNIYGQIGINTNTPQGTLDIISYNDTGIVLPRVTSIEAVTDGNANPPTEGTTVYDLSRNTTCFYLTSGWVCLESDGFTNPCESNLIPGIYGSMNIDYIKSSNNEMNDFFGFDIAISADGNTMAVSASREHSNAFGINGNQNNNLRQYSGAVYVFQRTGGVWSQEAYIKASNPDEFDEFGQSVALSSDGNTLVISADHEDSNATGINGNQTDNSIPLAGAVYVFRRILSTWSQEAYIKPPNPGFGDQFGEELALSGDGNTLAVASAFEDSNATGINGDPFNNAALSSGAVYIYTWNASSWSQQAYIKASNAESGDLFGAALALSSDGNTLAVGAHQENGSIAGVNGDQTDNSKPNSGAVYVFNRIGIVWNQQAYIKASNPDSEDRFGNELALSNDGSTLAVGSYAESSSATGIDCYQFSNSYSWSGAVYVFSLNAGVWSQEAYIKPAVSDAGDIFGISISFANNGNTIAVGAFGEASNATGINGDPINDTNTYSGAAYIFTKTASVWSQAAYVKASNSDSWASFGRVDISEDGLTLGVGAWGQNRNGTGINNPPGSNTASNSGAVNVYTVN